MKNRIIVLLTAWLICCAVQPFSVAIAEETRMDTYVLDQHGTVYAYLPQILKDGEFYPLVIALNCTIRRFGNTPKAEIVETMHQEDAYTETAPGDIIQFKYALTLSIS